MRLNNSDILNPMYPKYTLFCLVLILYVPEIYIDLTHCILMDFPIQINTTRLGLSIIYVKGSQVEISKVC